MKISLNFRSTKYSLEVDENEKIGAARERFFDMIKDAHSDVNINDLKFVGMAKFLDNEKTFSEEGIKPDSTILVHKALPKKEKDSKKDVKTSTSTGTAMPPFSNMNVPPVDAFGGINSSVINNQMNLLLNDPETLDLTIKTIMPTATNEERELYKKTFVENCRRFKDNPELLKQMTSQMQGMVGNNNVNPYMPASPAMNPYSPVMPNYNIQPPPYNPYYINPYAQQYPMPSPTVPCFHGFYPLNYSLPGQPKEDMEKRFEVQLKTLNEMGYTNKQHNLQALAQTGGDVNDAVNLLLDWLAGQRKE
ncbi:Ubiquitin-like protein [Trachipleistophora hominis]|uniref:Ubiquitin-like protein n=1 Tax=Trachipleistophora hominis TaxID=72359 RepID=L7JY26_TRAHO|nr:Ubiquitin-like protein [Trachipleistophora hominis]